MCFAEGDGTVEEHSLGWSANSVNARYDVVVNLDSKARESLVHEWQSLLDYHQSLPTTRRDFQASNRQMQAENPLTHNPIIDSVGAGAEGLVEAAASLENTTIAIPCAHKWDGFLCTKCGLWHTADIRIHRDEKTAFSFSLVDDSLGQKFKNAYPGGGGAIKNERLGTLAHVLASLHGALDRWRSSEPSAWSDRTSSELPILIRICARIGGNASASCICDPSRINAVANSFVNILRNHPEIRASFGRDYFTLWNITIAFGNTLGCGGALQAIMEFYE